MKYFVFSDVHGCYDSLIQSLQKSEYDEQNPNHSLLFLGDAFDHGKNKHFEVYQFIKRNIERNKLIWLMGNHELYLLNNFKKNEVGSMTRDTIRSLAYGFDNQSINYSDNECLDVLRTHHVDVFMKEHILRYFEIEKYVFTHGFIPYDKKRNQYDPDFRTVEPNKWNYYHQVNGIKMVLSGVKIPNKTLVCGHIGAYYGNILKMYPNLKFDKKDFDKLSKKILKTAKIDPSPFKIYYGDGVIGIDSKTNDTDMVNIFVVDC